MPEVSNTVRLCYEYVLTLPRPQTNHSTYFPIAQSLLVMHRTVQTCMKREFDICYVMAKESLSFRKYLVLHELEERHSVYLGFAYKTEVSTQPLTYYINESQCQSFLNMFSTIFTVSLWMDSLMQVMGKMNWCWSSTAPRKIPTRDEIMCQVSLTRGSSESRC